MTTERKQKKAAPASLQIPSPKLRYYQSGNFLGRNDLQCISKIPTFQRNRLVCLQLTWRQHAPTEKAQHKTPEHSDLHVVATTKRNTNRDTKTPNRDLNPETPKYEPLVLPSLFPRSVGGEEQRRALV